MKSNIAAIRFLETLSVSEGPRGGERSRWTMSALAASRAVITPNMARTSGGCSLVDIEILDDAVAATMPAAQLMDLMVNLESIREWGSNLMREELTRKVGREWCLAALSARQRLEWFRQVHPGYEALFAHFHIASYLGMTPVALSRARNR